MYVLKLINLQSKSIFKTMWAEFFVQIGSVWRAFSYAHRVYA